MSMCPAPSVGHEAAGILDSSDITEIAQVNQIGEDSKDSSATTPTQSKTRDPSTSNGRRDKLDAPNVANVITTAFPIRPTTNLSQRVIVPPPISNLHIQTDLASLPTAMSTTRNSSPAKDTPTIMYDMPEVIDAALQQSLISPTTHIPIMSSSLRSNLSASSLASSLSPGSGLPSPYLASMTDLTPLPSPIVPSEQASAWRAEKFRSQSRSRGNSLDDSRSQARSSSQPPTQQSPQRKRKTYGSLMHETAMANAASAHGTAPARDPSETASHNRNRSISDFVPEQLQNTRQRHVTFGPGDTSSIEASEYQMHREAYLAASRGVTPTHIEDVKQLPTPPPSTSSVAESEEVDDEQPYLEDGTTSEYLVIHCGIHNKRRKFRQLRQLGRGTFSTVMLATREKVPAHPTPEIEEHLDPHKLVAVKIVEHGPAGGADEERIDISLKREIEMLKSISHPSLIHLKACEYQESRTLLVLTYCPGGDLFEFASQKRDLLTPALIQRMFAELVHAVRYLHTHYIVHRDIKLENVLVNISDANLRAIADPATHSTPIVTLTDLGLSRRIPQPPESPFLTTRCGSEDYAAPEILLGQPYDGRQTDAWALGVLLYALIEGRLPFDAPPGRPDRSRNTHRIARCDWIWCRFGDEYGEWDEVRGKDFVGARPCVEGLLKKVRMGRKPLEEIEGLEWIKEGIRVEGGLRMRAEDDDSDLL